MIGLNQLRTAYIHSPPSVRRVLSPLLSAIPARFRFGKTYTTFRKHIKRSREDVNFVAMWRRDRLRSLIHSAVTKSPHYRAVAERTGLDMSAASKFDVEDLAHFPILTKSELRNHVQELLTCPRDRLDEVSTSGSSGVPLSFYLDKDRSAKEWAFVQDSWSRIGYEPNRIRAVLRGLHLDDVDRRPWEFEPALGELRLSPFHLTDAWMAKYCELIVRFNATFLHGYPSALAIFSGHVSKTRRQDVSKRIRGVITASETLFPHQRESIAQAFPDARMTSFYGMSEKVLFGSEIAGDAGTFEMEPLYGVAELVDDDGNRVEKPGEKGRVIGTGLLFQGMPLIRYDTGDLAILVENASPKNLFRLKVKNIVSRWGQEFLVGSNGQLISMTAINIHSPAYAKISAFQFQQLVPGRVSCLVAPVPGCTIEDARPFIEEISAKIGTSLTFDIKVVPGLAQNFRGKSKFIDQQIDLANYRSASV